MAVVKQAELCESLMGLVVERARDRMDLAVKKATENAVWKAEHPNTDKWVPTDPGVLARDAVVLCMPRMRGMGDYELRDQIKALRRELSALERQIERGDW